MENVSGVGLGLVLSQKVKDGILCPVAYANRMLQPQEQNYGATELKAFQMVWADKHFRHSLYKYKCVVFTDNEHPKYAKPFW